MACLDMYNNNSDTTNNNNNNTNKNHSYNYPPPISPRISFSNDFVDSQQIIKQERSSLRSESSADFEFSVSNNFSIMSGADELFFKGKLLPFKENNNTQRTIRDALLVDDDDINGNNNSNGRPPKGSSSSSSTRWKGFLGLRRSHIGSKKVESKNINNSCDASFVFDQDLHVAKTSQEILNEGGTSQRDVEIGI